MNTEIGKALVQDSLYQVLDNKIFRLMILLVIVFVVPAWVVAFRDDGISVLFGWKEFEYDEIASFFAFSLSNSGDLDLQQAFIQGMQTIFVEGMAGALGISLAVAATAFFVPRMLEKGAADALFSKPVNRLSLLLARYFSGVLFVAFLAVLLVGGMHLGLLVVSGYSDPGFLWSAVVLVYLFAIVHAFSVCVATVTRSSVAAILTTVFMFMLSGCVHAGWISKEYFTTRTDMEELLESARQIGRQLEEENDDGSNEEKGEKTEEDKEERFDERFGWIVATLDGFHFILPKTTESDYLIKILRKKLEKGPLYELRDEKGFLMIDDPLENFERLGEREVDLAEHTAAWIRRDEEGTEDVRFELRRFNRKPSVEEQETGRKPRMLSASGMGKMRVDELKDRSEVVEKPKKIRGSVDHIFSMGIKWREETVDGVEHRRTTYFPFMDWMFEHEATFSDSVNEDERNKLLRSHLRNYQFARGEAGLMDPQEWFESQFGFSSPWRYNAWFSIGSTLLFCIACLGVAWWRLARIDF